jgi:hypothetical protein
MSFTVVTPFLTDSRYDAAAAQYADSASRLRMSGYQHASRYSHSGR